jgi:hypothetical protein
MVQLSPKRSNSVVAFGPRVMNITGSRDEFDLCKRYPRERHDKDFRNPCWSRCIRGFRLGNLRGSEFSEPVLSRFLSDFCAKTEYRSLLYREVP